MAVKNKLNEGCRGSTENLASKRQIQPKCGRMSRLTTRDGTAEPISRDQIIRRERGEGKVHFPCSSGLEQDWQPYPGDQYSTIIILHVSCPLPPKPAGFGE